MKSVLGFMTLHYGLPYLREAVTAILPQVNQLIILYTDRPSQGFQADIPCPDTEEELKAAITPIYQKDPRIIWVKGRWPNESEHLNAIHRYSAGYDWLFRLDADEIVPDGMVAEMVHKASQTNGKTFRIPFMHFWRSFSRVCRDGQKPVRLIRVNGGEGDTDLHAGEGDKWTVCHMGYAVPTRYIRYKLQVSGHRPEFRPNWYNDIWLTNEQKNVHPVMFEGHWNAEPFDKETLPAVLKGHKYFSMEVVEDA